MTHTHRPPPSQGPSLRRSAGILALASALVVLGSSTAAGQNAAFAWENATEFSYVTTSGNAFSTTLGLKSTLDGKSDLTALKFELGGIRAASSFTDRFALANGSGGFTITEVTRTEQSAENYFARTRLDRNLGENNFFAFGGAGWERNTFAGFNNRFSFVAGVGDAWVDTDRTLVKTDIGGTYTIQKDVTPPPGASEGFGGLRATIELRRALSETTEFKSTMVADENLSNTQDLRVDWTSSLSVALSEGLAFSTSYRLLFDNDPARIGVPVLDAPNGSPTGTETLVASSGTDGFLTVSLVIKL
jgi:putative salt-induced outer membrane protein YdiY